MPISSDYERLLRNRVSWHSGGGFNPIELHDWLFDFQRDLVEWAVRMGRAAIFADCGLGKTAMQLSWADNVYRKTGKPVLLLTPLAVGQQTALEAAKFGIHAAVSRDGSAREPIAIANYERLHLFDRSQFGGVVCDESSAIKNFDGKRKKLVTDFMRPVEYRLLCTATAAPNDFHELGTSSEALGRLGYRDMLTTFFKLEQAGGGLHWGRTKYRLRGHAERPFWQWVCSWARAIRKPSDLGYSDERFVLPDLREHERVVKNSTPRDGMLFSVPARGLREEREERRITIGERCELAAELSNHERPAVIWCHLNNEGDLLQKLMPDAVQVKGSMSEDQKEGALRDFSDGNIRVLITKPKIGCWGLNWQHCNDVITFPTHSFEQYYQAVRRCWRFGQANPVDVYVIATEGEVGVVKNLQRKQHQCERMFAELVACMNNELALVSDHEFDKNEKVPAWL